MEYLRPYCDTDRQHEVLDAYLAGGGSAGAAKALGCNSRTIRKVMATIKKRAARQGVSPEHDMTRAAPDGFHVKGVSTYYNDDGKASGQWVKTSIDHKRQDAIMRETLQAMVEEIKPVKAIAAPRKQLPESLLNCYIITDYHLGMNSWGEQTGADWDMSIAEDMLVAWFEQSIATSPAAQTAILAQLGDFLHYDGLDAVTPTSGHVLDADTRLQKMIRVSIRVIRKVVGMLLKKHDKVHVLMAQGNHDLASSAWLAEMFAALYDQEPRVTVDTNPDPYYCYEHGKTSLFFHHGHKKRLANLDTVMAAKFRDVFGKTQHSYCHAGHLHHTRALESNLMTTEQHRTLAAPDAYASTGGYISGRSSPVITYHKEYGEVARQVISAEMLQ